MIRSQSSDHVLAFRLKVRVSIKLRAQWPTEQARGGGQGNARMRAPFTSAERARSVVSGSSSGVGLLLRLACWHRQFRSAYTCQWHLSVAAAARAERHARLREIRTYTAISFRKSVAPIVTVWFIATRFTRTHAHSHGHVSKSECVRARTDHQKIVSDLPTDPFLVRRREVSDSRNGRASGVFNAHEQTKSCIIASGCAFATRRPGFI